MYFLKGLSLLSAVIRDISLANNTMHLNKQSKLYLHMRLIIQHVKLCN